jgi:transcriptional regulator with XRE-family HTH domain
MIKFGDFIKILRIEKGVTLREFCRLTNIDPSNWSKIERGILPPPKSKEVLNEISQALKIKKESDEWHTIFDLATIGHIPTELLSDQSIVEKLPVFFRTNRGQKPTRKELEELIKIIKDK